MRSPSLRSMLTEGAIGMSVCLGVHLMMLDPIRQELAEVRGQVDVLRGNAASGEPTDDLPAAFASLETSRRRAAVIRDHGASARDEGALFTLLMQTAEKCNARIDHLDPKAEAADASRFSLRSVGAGVAAAPLLPSGPKDAALAYAVSFSADYSSACQFLTALQHDMGYTLVKSMTIRPSAEAGSLSLQVNLETSHYAFDASPVPFEAAPNSSEGAAK